MFFNGKLHFTLKSVFLQVFTLMQQDMYVMVSINLQISVALSG
jgi:hypothetical protein